MRLSSPKADCSRRVSRGKISNYNPCLSIGRQGAPSKEIKMRKRAQNITEYAVLLAIIASAIVAMQVYVKRGVQGRIKELADQLGPTHHEESNIISDYTTIQQGTTVQTYNAGVSGSRVNETVIRTGGQRSWPALRSVTTP